MLAVSHLVGAVIIIGPFYCYCYEKCHSQAGAGGGGDGGDADSGDSEAMDGSTLGSSTIMNSDSVWQNSIPTLPTSSSSSFLLP